MAFIGSKKTFTVWARCSLLHVDPTELAEPKRAASSLMPLQRVDDFVEFQSTFLTRMNHQIDAGEWQSLDQKQLSQTGLGIPFSMLP
jgi:hypothetical protein